MSSENVIPHKKYALGAPTPSSAALKNFNDQAMKHTKALKGGKITVPSFTTSANPPSPTGANHISSTTNHTNLQTIENAKYDHMVDAKPKSVPLSQVRGGRRSKRRSHRRSKSRNLRRKTRRSTGRKRRVRRNTKSRSKGTRRSRRRRKH